MKNGVFGFKAAKENARSLSVTLGNANHILGIAEETKSRDNKIITTNRNTHEI